jgi:hypothetical protein
MQMTTIVSAIVASRRRRVRFEVVQAASGYITRFFGRKWRDLVASSEAL